jgi:hypothetical protein
MAPTLVLMQQFTLYVCCFKNVGMQGTSLHIAVKHPQTWKIKLVLNFLTSGKKNSFCEISFLLQSESCIKHHKLS